MPSIGFNVVNPAAALSGNEATVTTDALGTSSGIDLNVEKTVLAVSVFYLSGPVDNTVEKFSIISIISAPKPLVRIHLSALRRLFPAGNPSL